MSELRPLVGFRRVNVGFRLRNGTAGRPLQS
jgi:hypothetical protein